MCEFKAREEPPVQLGFHTYMSCRIGCADRTTCINTGKIDNPWL